MSRCARGETATLRVKLLVGSEKSEVTVYGTTAGVRADAQIGRRLDSPTIDETPILGRKITHAAALQLRLPPGQGHRRSVRQRHLFRDRRRQPAHDDLHLDGVNNDEGWGRQTMLATVPIGAVQEMNVLSNAFSAEFGFTAGPARQHRHQVGHQPAARRRAVHGASRRLAGQDLRHRPGSARHRSSSCTTPTTLDGNQSRRCARCVEPVVGIGRRARSSRTRRSSSRAATTRARIGRRSCRPRCRRSCCRPTATWLTSATTVRGSSTARIDHKITPNQTLMVRVQRRSVLRHQSERRRRRHQRARASRAAYTRGAVTGQANVTTVAEPEHRQRSAVRLSRRRSGDAVGSAVALDRLHSRRVGTVHDRPIASRPTRSAASRSCPTRCRGRAASQTIRLGGSVARHTSGGFGNEPGFAVLGTFTFLNTTTAPFDQLKLADVQNYTQPISYGITELQPESVARRRRSRRTASASATISRSTSGCATTCRRSPTRRTNFAPRVGFGWHPGGDSRLSIRGGYGMYYTQIQIQPASPAT